MTQTDVGWLLERCIGSSEDAWQDFVARFGRCLSSAVRRTLVRLGASADQDTVEDLVQEVYCRLLERDRRALRRCRARTRVGLIAYLRTICDSVVVDRLRARTAMKRGEGYREVAMDVARGVESMVFDPAPSPEARMLGKESRQRFRSTFHGAVSGPRAGRNWRILELAFVYGWSSREIAEGFATDLKASSIDSLVLRARRRLGSVGVTLPER